MRFSMLAQLGMGFDCPILGFLLVIVLAPLSIAFLSSLIYLAIRRHNADRTTVEITSDGINRAKLPQDNSMS